MIPVTEPKFSMNLERPESHETCHGFQHFGFFRQRSHAASPTAMRNLRPTPPPCLNAGLNRGKYVPD
jgi:hypothetical protein